MQHASHPEIASPSSTRVSPRPSTYTTLCARQDLSMQPSTFNVALAVHHVCSRQHSTVSSRRRTQIFHAPSHLVVVPRHMHHSSPFPAPVSILNTRHRITMTHSPPVPLVSTSSADSSPASSSPLARLPFARNMLSSRPEIDGLVRPAGSRLQSISHQQSVSHRKGRRTVGFCTAGFCREIGGGLCCLWSERCSTCLV